MPAFDVRAATRAPLGGYDAVPRTIHQIWLGSFSGRYDNDLAPLVRQWQSYARTLGYEHHLWTEDDIAALAPHMQPRNVALIQRFISQRSYHAAADILRLELVSILGGVYFDCDFAPPTLDKAFVDLAQFLPMRGTAFAAEPDGRNIGKSGIFVMNGFFMAPPGHPQIAHLVSHMAEHVAVWEREQGDIEAPYTTGPFYVNTALSGAYVIMPHTFLQELGMVNAFWPVG